VHRLVPLLALLALSCGNTARPDYLIHLVTAQGGNPFATDCTNGSVRVDVRQGTSAPLTSTALITGGVLGSLAVEIPSYGLLTQIEVQVTCTAGGTLIGATPQFIPVGYGFVNIVLGTPGTCDPISTPALVPSRTSPRFLSLGANVVVVGGLDGTSAALDEFQSINPLQLTFSEPAGNFPSLSLPIGAAGVAPLADTRFVFVSAALSAIYDASQTGTGVQTTLTDLYFGANDESAVVDLHGNGVAVLGGFDGSGGLTEVRWIATDGTITHGQLRHPRRRPAATFLNGSVLVAGGQEPGAPLFEILALSSATSMAFGSPTDSRYAPVITTNANRSAAFVGLGTASPDDGAVAATTYVLSECRSSSGCTVASGPTFSDLQSHRAVVEHEVGDVGGTTAVLETWLIGGTDDGATTSSTLIDRIRFAADGTVSITPMRGMLRVGRSDPGATDIGAGVVLVGGGADDHGQALASLEVCFPEALRPLTAP
jgi:hypothetical protein